MKHYIKYCNVCKKRIEKNNKNVLKILYELLLSISRLNDYNYNIYDFDICYDCYKSFKNWLKSRRSKK